MFVEMNVANICGSTNGSLFQIIHVFVGAGKIANILCLLILIATIFQWEIIKWKDFRHLC